MLDIVTFGSATIDVFVRTNSKATEIRKDNDHEDVCYHLGDKILIQDLHLETGGGGTNTAVAFSRLGFKTGWVGKLGTDANSKHIRETVEQEGVQILGTTGAGMSGYSVILTGLQQNRTALTYKGINDALTQDEVDWQTLRRQKPTWFYLASLHGKSFQTLLAAARFARQQKIKCAFNPSTYIAALGLAKLAPVINGCDVLVLNKEEANLVLGMKNKESSFVAKKLQEHAKIVVVTDGSDGAVATDGIFLYTIKPNTVRVVEPTGAGDAFAAGFIAGLELYKEIPKAMNLGLAEAESVIQHIGAKEKLLTRKQAEGAMKKPVKVIVRTL